MKHDFSEKLAFSKGYRQDNDLEIIRTMLDGCNLVVKTNDADDRAGVDYIATLRNGARVLIDAKARERGCSRFWHSGPELALEDWSVIPGGKYQTPRERAKAGWTLCEKKPTDLILFTFDPSDSDEVFLFSYQLLRIAFRRNIGKWRERFKEDTQDSGSWQSHCIYVPATTVYTAMYEVSRARLPVPLTG